MIDQNLVKTIVTEVLKSIDLRERIKPCSVPCGVSSRHIHLSPTDLETLFGAGYQLSSLKPLSQPGQYAAKETLMIAGPKGSIEKCRVLGPTRSATQVEISTTDSFKLGVPAIVRDSGDIKNTPGCTILGPKGSVIIKEGVIVASRHMHLSTTEAQQFGLKDMDKVAIRTTGPKSVVFNNVLVRVNDNYSLDFHIDTDEANAAGIQNGDMVEIIA